MGLDNQGHVRYPLYNASKNETLKIEERGKTSWEPPPPLKVQCIKKMKKEQKKLLSNYVLHSKETLQMCKLMLNEYFVEEVDVCMDLMK
jgi:hypothetical protein